MNTAEENESGWEEEEGSFDFDETTETEQLEQNIRLNLTIDPKQESYRIDKFIMNRVEGATRTKIQQSIDAGLVLVNGSITKSNYKIKAGDQIILYETREPATQFITPEYLPLEIVYEDQDLIVINKAAGIVVHPGCGNYSGTLVNGLKYYLYNGEENEDKLPRVGLVHRIDKNTSGLIVVAKNLDAMINLQAQFKAHTVHRRYRALAWGDFMEETGTIEAHIGRNERYRKIMAAYPEGEQGKQAITHYKVLKKFGYVTLLEFRLETGRTHQIRVHSSFIGHPLFGDETYGGDKIVKGTVFTKYKQFVDNCFKILPRQALHAKELGFIHPTTNEEMLFDSPMPDDINEVLEKWEGYTKNLQPN